uniref:ribosomal protein L21 n=1 Tax=Anemia phyllitidis TaxID=12940 RepID=UPI0021ABC8F3|nr:ribosomal protein L21 [Anemia phyllitidis]UUL71121.1 ribosomal protein L21 [Anemia phyllitidis]
MDRYAIIDIGGKQFRVEQGRFYDIHSLASLKNDALDSESNTKISINRISLIRSKSRIIIGRPWLENATVRGRILHSCFEEKNLIGEVRSKKNKAGKRSGYRQNLTRFIVDSIFINGRDINDN